MVPPLPQELLDYILDHLHDDKHALKCCSTACLSLLPTSSFHLFQEVALGRRLCAPTSEVLRRFARAVEKSPRLRTHTRGLSLSPPLRTRRSQGASLGIDLHVLRDTLEQLPSLRTIDLRYVQILPHGPVQSLSHPSLRKVVLGTLHHPEPSRLRDILPLLFGVRLGTLVLFGQWAEDSDPVQYQTLSLIRVSCLSFQERNADNSGSCLAALRLSTDPGSLRELRIALESLATAHHVNSLVRQGSPNLRALHFDLTELRLSCIGGGTVPSIAAISECASLQGISFKLTMCSRDAHHALMSTMAWSFVLQVLSHAPPTIRKVVFSMEACPRFHSQCVPETRDETHSLRLSRLQTLLGRLLGLVSVTLELVPLGFSHEPLIEEMRHALKWVKSAHSTKYEVS
ncbi:uncharacterized protein PHACADRAFT_183163, partial [Phanerochaete carnosa HHB-10118-sp]